MKHCKEWKMEGSKFIFPELSALTPKMNPLQLKRGDGRRLLWWAQVTNEFLWFKVFWNWCCSHLIILESRWRHEGAIEWGHWRGATEVGGEVQCQDLTCILAIVGLISLSGIGSFGHYSSRKHLLDTYIMLDPVLDARDMGDQDMMAEFAINGKNKFSGENYERPIRL